MELAVGQSTTHSQSVQNSQVDLRPLVVLLRGACCCCWLVKVFIGVVGQATLHQVNRRGYDCVGVYVLCVDVCMAENAAPFQGLQPPKKTGLV